MQKCGGQYSDSSGFIFKDMAFTIIQRLSQVFKCYFWPKTRISNSLGDPKWWAHSLNFNRYRLFTGNSCEGRALPAGFDNRVLKNCQRPVHLNYCLTARFMKTAWSCLTGPWSEPPGLALRHFLTSWNHLGPGYASLACCPGRGRRVLASQLRNAYLNLLA